MGKGYRQGRLAGEIQKIISDMLLRELKDPRLAGYMISITSCEVTSDGSYATVYLSVMTTDPKDQAMAEDEVLEGMEHSRGVIRRRIGKKVKIRHIPELVFKIDRSMEYGSHMDRLIDEVMKHDRNEE